MKTKKGDFIEVDYVARTKDDNKIFDLTSEELAKENNLYQENKDYPSVIICLGYNDVLPGLDEQLINKDLGKYKIEVNTEKAFGRKSYNLIKLVPTEIFKKQDIQPFPGLHVNLDEIYGVIKSVSGGRTIVDFNHPLAGRDVVYDIEIKSLVTNLNEKVTSVLNLIGKEVKFSINNDKLTVNLKMNAKQKETLINEIKKRIPEITEVEFEKTTTPE